jgi:hypothetical protein
MMSTNATEVHPLLTANGTLAVAGRRMLPFQRAIR